MQAQRLADRFFTITDAVYTIIQLIFVSLLGLKFLIYLSFLTIKAKRQNQYC